MNPIELIGPASVVDARTAAVSVLLALGLSLVIVAAYLRSFKGLSYARTTVQGMVLAGVVSSTLMLAVGTSLAAGLGVAAGLAAIRFRSTLRDPRDVVFLFATMTVGVATGVQAYATAMLGTAVFAVAALALDLTEFGSQKHCDGLVRFAAPLGGEAEVGIHEALRTNTRSFVLVTLREAAQGASMEHAYQVTFRDDAGSARLVASLRAVSGVHDVTLLSHEPTVDL